MERIWRATINSWNGLIAVTRSEAAFRQELGLLAIGTDGQPILFLDGRADGRRGQATPRQEPWASSGTLRSERRRSSATSSGW